MLLYLFRGGRRLDCWVWKLLLILGQGYRVTARSMCAYVAGQEELLLEL